MKIQSFEKSLASLSKIKKQMMALNNQALKQGLVNIEINPDQEIINYLRSNIIKKLKLATGSKTLVNKLFSSINQAEDLSDRMSDVELSCSRKNTEELVEQLQYAIVALVNEMREKITMANLPVTA